MSYVGIKPPVIRDTRIPGYTGFPGALAHNSSYDSPQDAIWLRSCDSIRTPGFRSVAKRDLPMNRFYSYTFVMKDSYGIISRVDNGYTYQGHGKAVCGTSLIALRQCDLSSTVSDVVLAESKMRCLSSMSNMQMNLAQAYAERRQTANMLIQTVNRFATFAVAFRRGNFRAANNILRGRDGLFGGHVVRLPTRRRPFNSRDAFANAWLEYSYGWKPLVNDVFGAAELLAQTYTETRPTKAQGSANRTTTQNIAYGPDEGLTATGQIHCKMSAKTVVYFDVDNAALDLLKRTGLSNPALLAWELLPYSFVADWFLPVGPYLQAVAASNGLRFVKGYTSQRTVWVGTALTSSDHSRWVTSDFEAKLEGAQLYRNPLSDFPSATLPSFRLPISLNQGLSALALINQLFPRR